jgi:hypothetical protein
MYFSVVEQMTVLVSPGVNFYDICLFLQENWHFSLKSNVNIRYLHALCSCVLSRKRQFFAIFPGENVF